jgi:hypothetical protein
MAILRGGVRIGGFDVRLGLPRDRSLENVANDPRFNEKPFPVSADNISDDPRFSETKNRNLRGRPTSETTMGRVQSYVNQAEGFARKARFYVEFNLPKPDGGLSNNSNENLSQASQEEALSFKTNNDMANYQNNNGRRVNAFCKSINMPEREVVMKETRHNGPPRKFAIDFKSAAITATFYCDKFLRERTYFELWQQSAFSLKTFNYNFYDNYVSDVNIFQLGSFDTRNERDATTYAVKLFDCYPKIISPVEYDYTQNDVQTFTVTFEFRYWINYTIDRNNQITLGQSDYPDVTVVRDKNRVNEIRTAGAYGAPISGLPPELRRAGGQVLEQLKRSLPIGRIFGGRVFPPFF